MCWAEKLILKKASLKLILKTPAEIAKILINLLNLTNEVKHNLLEMVECWIHFAMNEFSIYKKYNLFIISISCLFIGVSILEKNENLFILSNVNEKCISSKQLIKNKIQQLGIVNSFNILEECEKDIKLLFDNSEEETENLDDDDQCSARTRSGSVNSLSETSNFFENDKNLKFVSFEIVPEKENETISFKNDNKQFLSKKRKNIHNH